MKEEVLIVGSGFSGAVLAREFADHTSLPITVVEKRNVVSGNIYDELDENGIMVHKYGPHVIFTDQYAVIEYLSRFAEMIPHECKSLSFIDNKYIQLPYNFKSIQQLFPLDRAAQIIRVLKEAYPHQASVTIYELLSSENSVIQEFARDLFEKAFKPYIAKKWDLPIEEIDTSVINRVPFHLSYVERYLVGDFQMFPKDGFTSLITKMLTHDNIKVVLNEDANTYISFKNDKCLYKGQEYKYVFYTGAIDDLFNYRLGALPYRSLRFQYDYYNQNRYLPCEIISYPSGGDFTRKTEYKFFAPSIVKTNKTLVVTEWSIDYNKENDSTNPQCYPVINEVNCELYQRYSSIANQYENLYLVGRLAKYKYYNMDAAIIAAWDTARALIKKDFL